MKMKQVLIGVALVLSFAAQAAVVSWDGTSTDITSIGNVSAVPGGFTAADQTWDTAYNWIPAQGDQAAVKMAISQIQQTHKAMQINGGQDSLFIGGGGRPDQSKIDVTPGFSGLYAFDTGLFDAAGALTNLSVTLAERAVNDTPSFRWFVVTDGTPYVSASVAADVGSTRTTYTMADPASEVWYAFDGSTNLEAAVGGSVGTLPLTNLTYAGVMTTLDALSVNQNWRGMYVHQFIAETDGGAQNQAPVADAQNVGVVVNTSVDITLTGSDPEGSNVTYSVESSPTNGVLSLVTNQTYTYTPNTDYLGPDSFMFTVNDGEKDSAPATISISVNTNSPPVADAQDVIVEKNTFVDITLTGSDPNGSTLTYAVADAPTNGVLSAVTGTNHLIYTPNTDYAGPDSFTFTVNDGITNSEPATVSIVVYTPATGGLYFEDFETNPGYTPSNDHAVGAAGSAKPYHAFGEWGGTADIGITQTNGALQISSNTSGGSARNRGFTVTIDTSAAGIGTYTVSFDVTNFVANTGTAGMAVHEGSGLDTLYAQWDVGGNSAADAWPRNQGTAPSTIIGDTGSRGTGISSNGTYSFEVDLTAEGQPGDYITLAFAQIRTTSTALAPTFDIDNVWVGVGDAPSGGGPITDPVITAFNVSGSDVILTWTAGNNGTYSIQRKTSLQSVSWTDVLTGLPAGGGTTNVPVSGASEEFYQIYGE